MLGAYVLLTSPPELESKGSSLKCSSNKASFRNLQVLIIEYDYSKNWILRYNPNFKYSVLSSVIY